MYTSTGQKEPKEPKEPKGPKGEPVEHAQGLEWKQTLGVSALIIETGLIIFAVLQTKLSAGCVSSFRKTQCVRSSGKALFILWLVALITSYVSIVVFVHLIFHLDDLSDEAYAFCLIFAMAPYRVSKLCMGMFFILRVYFVFNRSALAVKKWIIVLLSSLLVIGTALGVFAGTVGPLKLWDRPIYIAATGLGITMLVDVLVMILYVERLVEVTILGAEVKTRKSTDVRSDAMQTKSVELQTRTLETTATREGGRISASGFEDQDGEEDEEQADVQTPGQDEEEVVEVQVSDKMVAQITKATLLSLIGILTSFWLHLEMLILIAKEATDGVLFRAIASLDGAINVICMYLVFGFAAPYYRVLCKCCDTGMRKLCTVVSKKAVLRAKAKSV